MEYLDFEIEIRSGLGREFAVVVLNSPAGEASETMPFPYDKLELETRLQALQIALLRSGGKRRKILTPSEQSVQDFGKDMFETLLVGEIRNRYDLSQVEATRAGKGLRIKLRIQPPEIAALPWEFLYDPRESEYICLSRNTPLIRYLEIPKAIKPLTVQHPLRILGMIAAPEDQASLDIPREKLRVERAIDRLAHAGSIELTWLEGQTWRHLQEALQRGPWHIFHFIGHGRFDHNTDEGLVALADEEGLTHYMSATQLGRLLADHHTLRLALLNSCEGGRGSERDIFSSTAAILVRRGIPAVIAMQYEITDEAAIEFSRTFYTALTNGLPVDAAVAEARKAISLAVINTFEWGTPVLYLRAPDGQIFDLPPDRAEPAVRPPTPEPERALEEDSLKQHYSRGLSAYWLEEWEEAAQNLQRVVDQDADYQDAAVKLAEARRQAELAVRYAEATNALETSDWASARASLEMIAAVDPDYEDSAALLARALKQKKISNLYAQAQEQHRANQWEAVINTLAQIRTIDADFSDPDGLLDSAEEEIKAEESKRELENLYYRALLAINEGRQEEARGLLKKVQETDRDYEDTGLLLERLEAELSQREEEEQKRARVAGLYAQALELSRSGQWEEVLEKNEAIQSIQPQFSDPDGIFPLAQQKLTEEMEAARQRQARVVEEPLPERTARPRTTLIVIGAVAVIVVIIIVLSMLNGAVGPAQQGVRLAGGCNRVYDSGTRTEIHFVPEVSGERFHIEKSDFAGVQVIYEEGEAFAGQSYTWDWIIAEEPGDYTLRALVFRGDETIFSGECRFGVR